MRSHRAWLDPQVSVPSSRPEQMNGRILHMMNPALFFSSSSFRSSLIFSWKGFPAYLTGWTLTFSLGRGGRSLPQTRSTRFCFTPTSCAPDLLRVSASLRALAVWFQRRSFSNVPREGWLHSQAVMVVGSTPTTFPPSACSVVLTTAQHTSHKSTCAPYRGSYHSCHVGTPSIPRFSSSQLLSSCLEAWLKYRPSVDRAALSSDTTAVPAEPVKPEMNSAPGCEYEGGIRQRRHGRL